MTSLLDLEDDPNRTDYFGNVMTDAIEPSSSPSDSGGFPYRTRIEEQIRRAADLGSPAAAANPRYWNHAYQTEEDDMSSRKQARDFARESREVRKMGTLLLLTTERLDEETRKANEAERKVREMVTLVRSTMEAKMMAQQETARVNEELRLYKLQYENAQSEIFKAQEVINRIELQRQEAEEAAARARSTARKLKEQNLVMIAKEEGRALGFQEGLARGRKLGYDEAFRFSTPVQEDYLVPSEVQSEEEDYALVEQPSSIGLRSPIPVPIREQEQHESHISRPASRSARRHHDAALHAANPPVPTVTTPINASSPSHAAQQSPSPLPSPPPILAPSISRQHNRSDSAAYSISSRRSASPSCAIPPDSWIPVADENNYIAMPPPHTMAPPSPTISPSYQSQPLPKSAPTPTPEQHESNTPAASSVRVNVYNAESSRKQLGESRESLQIPLRASTPGSQTSTRMSDYGLLTSPVRDNLLPAPGPPPPLPVFREVATEPSSSDDKASWKYDSGSRSKGNPVPRVSSPRVSGGPRSRPESITKPPLLVSMIIPPPPIVEERSKGPKRSTTSSSSSSSATSSSSLDHLKNNSKRDSDGGSRTPLGWIKKKIRDRMSTVSTGGADSGIPVPDITIQSPSISSPSNPGTDSSTAQPGLLSPAYHEDPLPSLSQPQPTQRSKTPVVGEKQWTSQQDEYRTNRSQLTPLAELGNLISPDPVAIGDLPPRFVPFAPPQPPVRAPSRVADGPANQGRKRSGSVRSVKGKAKDGSEEWYETIPLPPGVLYYQPPPFLPPSRDMTRSRASSRKELGSDHADGGWVDAAPRVYRI